MIFRGKEPVSSNHKSNVLITAHQGRRQGEGAKLEGGSSKFVTPPLEREGK